MESHASLTASGRRWGTGPRSGRPRSAWAVAAVAVSIACATLPAPSRAAPGQQTAIRQLLERRADAVVEGDREVFAATMSRDSPGFVRRQLGAFDALEEVPLASYGLEARWDLMGDLVRPSDRRRYADADDVAIALVEELYRIEGFDPEPAVESLLLTFVQRDGKWLVADDDDLDDLGLYSTRHLWDFGEVEVRRSRRFLLLRHPCAPCTPSSSDLLALAEQAADAVGGSAWPLEWRRKIVLLVPDSSSELARMIQATVELDDFVAFAYSTVDVDPDFSLTGHRVMLNPPAFVGRSAAGTRSVLVHEFAHVATRPLSGPLIPVLVEEGQAEYVARHGQPGALSYLQAALSSGATGAKLPHDFEFMAGTGSQIYTSYQKALSAARFFVERFGMKAFTRFYRRLGARRYVAGTARYHFDRALRAVTGMSARAFEQAWADSIGA